MSNIYLLGLPLERYTQPMLGLGYIGASLLNHGNNVKLHDSTSPNAGKLEQIEKEIRTFNPEYFGISVLSTQYLRAIEVFKLVKKINRNIVTVIGGPHASALPEFILKNVPEIDFCFVGEAEESFPMFIDLHSKNRFEKENLSIPGVAYRNNNKIYINQPKAIKDLNTLESPWKFLNPLNYNKGALQGYTCKRRPVVTVMSSRGCPYRCTYCAQMPVFNYNFRTVDPDKLVNELEYLNTKFGIKEIQFADDNFTFYRDYAEKVCLNILNRKLDISWALINGVRIDKIDEKLLKLMKKAGCYYMAFGIEFGSPRMLKLCKKGLNEEGLNKGYENIKIANKLGFITHGFFLMGHPQEKKEDIQMTQKLIYSLRLDRISIGMPIAYPGSELFFYYFEKKYKTLEAIDWNEFIEGNFKPIWEYLDGDYIIKKIKETYHRFYINPIRILRFITKFRTFEQFKATYNGFRKGLLNILRVFEKQK